MPIEIKLSQKITADRLEQDLRTAFPALKIRRGMFGSIHALPRFNLRVFFIVRAGKVRIYATFPLWYAFFFTQGRDGWGYSDDEKRVAEKTYENWFRLKYCDHLSD